MPKYDPFAVRRCVRATGLVNGDIVTFATKSFTSDASEDKYHPAVDISTGAVTCDCPHFTYRLARLNPTATEADRQCKHLQRAVENLRRKGLL